MRYLQYSSRPDLSHDENNDEFFHSYRHLAVVPDTPTVFTLELTTLCNNSCSGCANIQLHEARKKDGIGVQKMEKWERIIDRIKPYAQLVRISGGEPTLHPEFKDIVRLLERSEVPHALLTTGRWSRIKPKEILGLFQNSQFFTGMLISLHGSNQSSHNSFVESAGRAFVETCGNIESAAQGGLTVYTNTVLTKFSCEEVEAIVELSLQLGAKYALFNRFLTNNHPLEPDNMQLKEALLTVERLRQSGFPCRVGNNVPPCFINTSSDGAKAGFELCHIAPNGDIRPDNLINLSFGNILENDLPSLWRSPAAEKYRISFSKDCLQCKAFSACRGGAKSLNLQYGLERDKLMQNPMKDYHPTKKDEYKESLEYLALTSD